MNKKPILFYTFLFLFLTLDIFSFIESGKRLKREHIKCGDSCLMPLPVYLFIGSFIELSFITWTVTIFLFFNLCKHTIWVIFLGILSIIWSMFATLLFVWILLIILVLPQALIDHSISYTLSECVLSFIWGLKIFIYPPFVYFIINHTRCSPDLYKSNSSKLIDSYKTFRFYNGQLDNNMIDKDDKSCIICTDEYEDETFVTRLKCNHHFHTDCITKWNQKQNSCPLCRKILSS